MRYLNGGKTQKDLLATCDAVLEAYQRGDKDPVVHGVTFEGVAGLGLCQKNVREAVEATAFGAERRWGEASCCATSTHQRLLDSGYLRVSLANAEPGDLCYLGPGGGHCSTCKQDPGHVGILHHQDPQSGQWWLWQNTSYQHMTLCCIPLRAEQKARVVGVYRLFPLAHNAADVPEGELKINYRGEWLDPEDVILVEHTHYVKLRAIAEAHGDVVRRDMASGKVYVGPASWWG